MSKSIILDANLIVLLTVGLVRLDQVGIHKRTRNYDKIDFALLSGIVANSKGLIFTPNVLTEASNLLRQTADPFRTQLSIFLANNIGANSEELLVKSMVGFERKEYQRLGLTDAVLLHLSSQAGDAVLLTADLDLYLAAVNDGLDCVNFTHIRAARSDLQ